MIRRKLNLVIFGIQGSGKGTQSKKISREFGIPHISTGDLLRAEKQKDTERGKLISSLIDKGNMVPDEMISEMVEYRLTEPDCTNGAISDGYPRNIAQAKVLGRIWEGGVTKAILIIISDKEAIKRALGRRNCSKCGKIYHLEYNPPKTEGVCDSCGGKLLWRDDDKEEAIKVRLEKYHKQTEPLIQFYRDRGLLVEIDGSGTIDEVYRQIKDVLEK